MIEPKFEVIKFDKKVVVFCDEGKSDWENYFKREFDVEHIEFTNIEVFESAKAFEQTFDVFMFDWGGMSLGNSMLDHFVRRLYHMAEDMPSRDFVLLSFFTETAYEDMLNRQYEKLFNIYSVEQYIEKIKNK